MLRRLPVWEAAAATSAPSPMLTEIATGWHVLKVEGYSKISGLGLGVAKRLKSCPFIVGGHTWCIAYFPDGLTKDTAGWISFALRLEHRAGAGAAAGSGRSEAVMVRTTFSLLDVDAGGPVPSHTVSCGMWTFSWIGQSWSHARFMKRKEFETCHVKGDVFRVRCDLTVLSADVPPDLRRHLGDLVASGDGMDLTLDIGGESFRAHKNVLAACSPVFKAEFYGGPHYTENAAARVSVDGVEQSVFSTLLHFVYTDTMPEIDAGDITAMAQHLLVAADRFAIERLKSICEYLLCTFLDASVVVTTLVIAEQHGCPDLKEACFKVIKSSPSNFKKLFVGEDLEYVASTCPSLVQELRDGEINFETVDLKLTHYDYRTPPVLSDATADADADTYGSSSTLSAETATGFHEHKVEDYLRTKNLDTARWLQQSNTFTVGGRSWRITCSPNGFLSSSDNAGWLCFGLRPEPPVAGDSNGADLDAAGIVRTVYCLVDQAGQRLPSSTRIDDSAHTLSSMLRGRSWTCTRFMKTERFEASSYLKDNRISVRCDVTVVTPTCRLTGAMPPPDLHRHLGNLLATGVGVDVMLEVGGEAFAVHRSVLGARSPVFRAELLGELPQVTQLKEDVAAVMTTTRVMRIHDTEPSVFKALLHFIYTDSLPEIDGASDATEMARQLLVAAQRYELDGLKWICEDVLCILCPQRAKKQIPSLADQMRAKVGGWPL